jgi:hypothetical protein
VWTSPLALENHARNHLAEFAALFGCLDALADRKKQTIKDLSKIDHRLLVSKTLQEASIGTMPVHDEVETFHHLKDFRGACLDGRQLEDCGMQGVHPSFACVILTSLERSSHDELKGSRKKPFASKALLTVVQGLGFRI